MIENLKVLLKMGYHGVFEKLLLFTYVTRIDLQHNTYANDREEDEDAEWKLANLYAGMAPTNSCKASEPLLPALPDTGNESYLMMHNIQVRHC